MLSRGPAFVLCINKPFTFAAGPAVGPRPPNTVSRFFFPIALCTILVVTALGSVLDVMEVDAAQYAAMSRDMMQQQDVLKLYHRGEDYLDKPPLLFWSSSLSFTLFGVHNWSYKLPSILFAFLGLFSTYRFTLLYHGREVARTAVLMLGSSAAFLLMTNDVRCDTILTGSVITAIWAGSAWTEQRRWWQLIVVALAVASGMLSKGPMGLMAPLLAIGGHVLLTRKWAAVLDLRWTLVPLLVALALVPMCIGLYEQHGMHGIRFYFWEQSFGRLTGENRWKDDSSPFFFAHEVVWQLLPWTLFTVLGTAGATVAIFRKEPQAEYVSISGVVLVFLALSLSQFKLPHYLYVIVPLFAVLAAVAWHRTWPRWMAMLHGALLALLCLAAFVLVVWSFPKGGLVFAVALGAVAIALLFTFFRARSLDLLRASFMLMTVVAAAINGHVYPQLLSYQANAQAGKWASAQGLGPEQFQSIRVGGTSLNFYAGYTVPWYADVNDMQLAPADGAVLYTDAESYAGLIARGFKPKEVIELPNFPVQLLSLAFLAPELRPTVVERHLLLRF